MMQTPSSLFDHIIIYRDRGGPGTGLSGYITIRTKLVGNTSFEGTTESTTQLKTCRLESFPPSPIANWQKVLFEACSGPLASIIPPAASSSSTPTPGSSLSRTGLSEQLRAVKG